MFSNQKSCRAERHKKEVAKGPLFEGNTKAVDAHPFQRQLVFAKLHVVNEWLSGASGWMLLTEREMYQINTSMLYGAKSCTKMLEEQEGSCG